MKRTLLTALTIPGLMLGLAACSDKQADDATGKESSAASPTGDAASKAAQPDGSSTSAAAPVPVQSRTMGAAPVNADQGEAKITKCEASDSGVAMTAEVKNTTKEKRTYILTGLAYDKNKKPVASAALMGEGAVEPGKTATIEGKSSPTTVKSKVTCEISELNSMAE